MLAVVTAPGLYFGKDVGGLGFWLVWLVVDEFHDASTHAGYLFIIQNNYLVPLKSVGFEWQSLGIATENLRI